MIEKLIRKDVVDLIPYEPGKPVEEVKRELGLKEVIKLASNENVLGPSPLAVKALKSSLHRIHLYPDGGGYYLRKKLASKYGLDISQVLLGNGSDEIIRMIVETFLNPGEEVITGEPAFIIYKMACKSMGGKCITVPLRDFTVDLSRMAEKITKKTKLIFIANPNNPTGTMVTEEEVEKFLQSVPPGVIVVFDEAYYEYIERKDFPDNVKRVKRGELVLVLRTFSKIYGLAGLRIGYCLARKDVITALNRVRQPFNTNSLAQTAAISALDDEEHIRKSREMVKEGKEYLYGEFKKIGLEFVPSETNFVLVKVNKNGREVFQELMKRGIIVRAMDGYGLCDWIRVTIGTLEENKKFIQSLARVLDFPG
ncbi:histidinol-phosphate transaminase [Candidatus Calescamantes bacterium]|nr:histidinol-phosphate transaminase [Candidatus Calescamantes bacterium]